MIDKLNFSLHDLITREEEMLLEYSTLNFGRTIAEK